MRNRTSGRVVGSLLVALGFGVGATTLGIRHSQAQTPRAFVSNFDLECFRAETSVVTERQLTLKHLNPVLIAAGTPSVAVRMGAIEQLCGAVQKNGVAPPSTVAEFLRYTDLACHHVDPLQTTPAVSLTLGQLNPVVTAAIPSATVTLNKLEQLCVPVMKNSLVAPPAVKRVIEQIDLACYQITLATAVPQISLNLTQLNPILAQRIPSTTIQTATPRQLCVPVAKNGNMPPSDVLNLVQWIDVEKFDIVSPAIASFTLNLTHLNPVLLDLPHATVTVSLPAQLALPVAKNGNIPPLQ